MAMFMEVKRIVGPSMRKQTRNGGAIPVETQILACLRLLASGIINELGKYTLNIKIISF